MLPALYWAQNMLNTRRGVTRKVCIWLCDGGPDHSGALIKREIERNRYGIEHVGIGLNIDLSTLFGQDRSVMVTDLTRLASAFERLLIETGDAAQRAA